MNYYTSLHKSLFTNILYKPNVTRISNDHDGIALITIMPDISTVLCYCALYFIAYSAQLMCVYPNYNHIRCNDVIVTSHRL